MSDMAAGHDIDGSLVSWPEIESACTWDTLLLGNGLSINVWPRFAYRSLYESAGTSAADRKVFAALGDTTNFERALGGLRTAIRLARACNQSEAPYEQRYRSIQAALGTAVRAVHIGRGVVPDGTLREIRRVLLAHERVFTTSYDLVVYWAMGYGETFDGFCDCFWSNGRNEFDAGNALIRDGIAAVFFLHGALHLVVENGGTTRKLTRDDRMLLEQFGRPVSGDARPLLVTEGSSTDKHAAIRRNDYLRFALEALEARETPVVVFGHSLSPQDQHLIDALNRNPGRPVAVSLLPDRAARVRRRQRRIRAILDAEQLYFYDATSHPLGAPGLRRPSW